MKLVIIIIILLFNLFQIFAITTHEYKLKCPVFQDIMLYSETSEYKNEISRNFKKIY